MSERSRLGVAAAAATVAILAALCVAAGFVREFSGDFHWHVVVGRQVWGGSLGQVDTLSHTFAGRPVFVSSWLADALLAAAFDAGGYPGAFALRAALVLLTFGVTLREMTRRGLPAGCGAALLCLALSWLLFRLYLRPELFAFAAMASVVHVLGEHERTPRRWQLPVALGIVVLWVNAHGSVVIGLMLIGVFAAEQAIRHRRDGRRLATFLLLPALAFAAACLNPEGVGGPTAFRVVSPTWVAHVPEWNPLSLGEVPPVLRFFGVAALLSTVVALAGRRGSAWSAVGFAVLAALSFRYQRFAAFALLAALPLLAGNLAAIARLLSRAGRSGWARAGGTALAAAVFTWGVAGLFVERRLHREIGLGLDPAWYPVEACRFARDARFPGRMFNSYDFGSYLLYCQPGVPVWIDQRAWSLYPDAFYRRYLDAGRDPAALRALADETGVTWGFVAYDAIAAGMAGDRAAWQLVYFDDQALIFVRAGTPSAVAPFVEVAPDRLPTLAHLRGAALATAQAEVARQVARCGTCVRTQLVRAAVAVAAGDDASFRDARDRLLARGESAELAYLAGRHALSRGEYALAAELFRRFAALGGDPVVAGVLGAEALARGGDRAGAARLLDEVAALPRGAEPAARARAAFLR